jgi:hypothetical protein
MLGGVVTTKEVQLPCHFWLEEIQTTVLNSYEHERKMVAINDTEWYDLVANIATILVTLTAMYIAKSLYSVFWKSLCT